MEVCELHSGHVIHLDQSLSLEQTRFALNVAFQAAQPSRLHPAPSITANQMTATSNNSTFKLTNEEAKSQRRVGTQNFSWFSLGQSLQSLLLLHIWHVIVDRDLKEVNAAQKVFPHCIILLCWFLVLQAVHRWMQHQVECKKHPAVKNEVIRSMIAHKESAAESDFEERSNQVVVSIDELTGTTTISNYLKMQWFKHSKMWANFGRRVFHQNNETNNLAWRFGYVCSILVTNPVPAYFGVALTHLI
ncbi:hypothetical protein AOLI_G00277700 [Acnodon oligacanthus]